MDRQILDAYEGANGNYILPFLWMKGETEEVIRRELARIDACSIKAVCLESRPHPDFMGPGWWHDFDIVLDEAKKRDMKIWILDDAHFPTGLANGLLPKKYPERAKQYLSKRICDTAGPKRHVELDLERANGAEFTWRDLTKPREEVYYHDNAVLRVEARRLLEDDTVSGESYVLYDGERAAGTAAFNPVLCGSRLIFDVPEGAWRIIVVYTTYDEGTRNEYINIIDGDSVKILLEAIHEPHYARYPEEFGKTIMGFFSDEPGYGNTFGFEFDEAIGRKNMPLPWNAEMPDLLEGRLGTNWREDLSLLWFSSDDKKKKADVRFAYMDAVTRLYEKNFSEQLGRWCADHNVEYIGHVIEDNGVHSRLGSGAGHYFRAMSGQAMAGIDDIGGQVVPGLPNSQRHGFGDTDGKFFHYTLAKLGASAALLQTGKKGRLMCETFGAYGWSFGVRDMKWVADHLISRGVNYLVPHAFSMDTYPDPDCPPHFYAGGHNPEYPYFAKLMQYCNRLCHVFQGGTWQPEVGILYDAEEDWMSGAMRDQVPARILYENQIDYCFLPSDLLAVVTDRDGCAPNSEGYDACVKDGRLLVSGVPLKVLIVPGTKYADPRVDAFSKEYPEVKVVYVDRAPYSSPLVKAVPKADLAGVLHELGVVGARTTLKTPVSFYHYKKETGDLWMVFNESMTRTQYGEVLVRLTDEQRVWRYDAMHNKIYAVEQIEATGFDTPVMICTVNLAPYESSVLFTATEEEVRPYLSEELSRDPSANVTDLSAGWEIEAATSADDPVFLPLSRYVGEVYPGGDAGSVPAGGKLCPISDVMPKFSGFLRYSRDIEIRDEKAPYVLTCENLYEVGRVYVNGKEADFRLCPPYRFELQGCFKKGINHLEIETANTPLRDVLNYEQGMGGHEKGLYEPSGMFGRVILEKL